MLIPASFRTCVTGIIVFLNRSTFSSSNLARDTVDEKSFPSASASHSTVAEFWLDSVRFAFSHCFRSRCTARLSFEMSTPSRRLNCAMKNDMRRWSKSCPPRWVSPAVASTSKTPLSIERRVTSNVPPPRSKTRMFSSRSRRSRPYAIAAAVGSLMTRSTVRPAIFPASFVACRCASLKYAGTVTTACVTGSPRKDSAISFILRRTMPEISSGENVLDVPAPSTSSIRTTGLPFLSPAMANGINFLSDWTVASEAFRPMRRFTSKTVLVGFCDAWFLAASPTSRDAPPPPDLSGRKAT